MHRHHYHSHSNITPIIDYRLPPITDYYVLCPRFSIKPFNFW